MKKTAIELFAGVGGFRVGLNHVTMDANEVVHEEDHFKFVWANQWEPATKSQEAFDCYKKRFSTKDSDESEFSNVDISLVNKKDIPDFTLLTGGFPCQDYSVAHSLSKEKGIEGKKGVLWWQINEILSVKNPPFVLLENVDRLLKSPAKQRGRDFGIMLKCFNDNNYSVEWRVINAADYGMPQRRRRTYIFAYKNNLKLGKKMSKLTPEEILNSEGLFANAFKTEKIENIKNVSLDGFEDLVDFSNRFSFNFEKAGYMTQNNVYTSGVAPIIEEQYTMDKIILHGDVDSKYFVSDKQNEKYKYLKGSKKIERVAANGHKYLYSEGAMGYPDVYNLPSRTMLTSEGTINRSTHVIEDRKTKKYRFLTPVECERLNQFPDNWTNTMTDRKRYFMMGNALVTGVIKRLGIIIERCIDLEK